MREDSEATCKDSGVQKPGTPPGTYKISGTL